MKLGGKASTSVGVDDQPATVRVMLPLSGFAAVVFVLPGQLI